METPPPEGAHPAEPGAAPEERSPYLVTFVANSTFVESPRRIPRPPWSSVNKSRYHRLLAFLEYWESHHFSIIRMDLTTAPGGSADLLGVHFEELLRRISRREKRQV